jgi:hypothetical protein
MMTTGTDTRYTIEKFEAGDIDPALRRLTAKVNAADKYNAMITWLFLLLIAARATEGENWSTFRARNKDLFEGCPQMATA